MSTYERNVKGLLGTKLGMTQTWDENNRIVPVTVVRADTNVVTQVRQPATDGYNAVQLGFGEVDGRSRHVLAPRHVDRLHPLSRHPEVELRRGVNHHLAPSHSGPKRIGIRQVADVALGPRLLESSPVARRAHQTVELVSFRG